MDELGIRPKILSLFLGSLQLGMSGRLYGGDFEGGLRFKMAEKVSQVGFKASGLHVSELPQLSGIGVTEGMVDLALNDLVVAQGLIAFGPSSLSIHNASKPQKNSLPPLLTGAPVPIDIPAIKDMNLQLNCEMKDNKLKIIDSMFSSSLGQLKVAGDVSFPGKSSVVGLSLNGRFELSTEGARELAVYLGSPGVRKFEFRLGGNTNSPEFSFKPSA